MSPEGSSSLTRARIIATALPLGVVVLWVVAWVLTRRENGGLSPDAFPPNLVVWLWAAVAMVGFGGAVAFWGRAMSAMAGHRRRGRREDSENVFARVEANLIVAWALLEGPAILAGVIFLLLGTSSILLAAAPFYFLGVAVTYPRAEWFGVYRRRGESP